MFYKSINTQYTTKKLPIKFQKKAIVKEFSKFYSSLIYTILKLLKFFNI